MKRYTRPPRVGSRVTFCPNPVSHALYSGRTPPAGRGGTVVTMPGMRGAGQFFPGPGGGLLYVRWDDFGTMGVSLLDVYPHGKSPCREGEMFVIEEGEALEGIVKLLLEENTGRGEKPWVIEVEADSFEEAVLKEFKDDYEEYLEDRKHVENFIEWLTTRNRGAYADDIRDFLRTHERDEAKTEFKGDYEQWLEELADTEEDIDEFLEWLYVTNRLSVEEVD